MSVKKISALALATAISVQTILSPAAVMAQEDTKNSQVATMDAKRAAEEAALHRGDGIQKADGVSLSAEEKPAVQAYTKDNKPNRLVVNIKEDPRTSRSFNWFTSDKLDSYVWVSENRDMKNAKAFPAEASVVDSHYVERDEKGFFIFQLIDNASNTVKKYFTDEGKKGQKWDHNKEITDKEKESVKIDVNKIPEYSYKADAKGLKPDTEYFYQAGSSTGGKSEVGSFRTADKDQDKFTFLQYTDTQNAYWNQNLIDEAAFGADTLRRALETAPDSEFVIHSGDIVEVAEVEDEWVDLFGKSKDSFLKTTLAPAPGNHDEYGLNYNEKFLTKFNDHFNVPSEGKIDGGSYYSYDYNGVHFVNLNTNDYKNDDNKAVGDEQQAWIKKDVQDARARGAQWVVLNYHKPIFSKSYHSLQDKDVQNVKDELMKLIDELDIDIALQGHDHVLSRTKSLRYAPKSESLFNGKIAEDSTKVSGIDTLKNPTGTTFVLPNTGGTKAYDAIYDKGIDHVKKVRPSLSWLTQDLLDEYNKLFAIGSQPQKAPEFANSHSNFRDSTFQNFAKYTVDGETLTTELYQVSGELDNRKVEKVDTFQIVKDKVDPNAKQLAPTDRYEGNTRYETAVEVSRNHYDKSETVILASGETFPDSTAAASLSDLYKAPILLSRKASLPDAVKAEISRLGAKKVLLLGGENALSSQVAESLKGLEVERIAGANRSETAALIADKVLSETKSKKAILVGGEEARFADALSAGLPVFKEDAPILFTRGEDIDSSTQNILKNKNIEEVYIIGGDAAVDSKAEETVKKNVKKADRIAGDNRYKTSIEVKNRFAPKASNVIVASGQDFADALVSSSILNSKEAPILLTNKENTIKEINQVLRNDSIERITVVGGKAAVGTLR